jgi:hypothetical protein
MVANVAVGAPILAPHQHMRDAQIRVRGQHMLNTDGSLAVPAG